MRLKTLTVAIMWIYLIAVPGTGVCAQSSSDARPAPDLTPTKVVSLQLRALRDNDPKTDAGIAAAYRFSSPSNRRAVGDSSHFARMIHLAFSDMLTETHAIVSLQNHGKSRAAVLATLVQDDGSRTHYLFLLSRQTDGPCTGCWLTDGVVPVALATPQDSEPMPLQPL